MTTTSMGFPSATVQAFCRTAPVRWVPRGDWGEGDTRIEDGRRGEKERGVFVVRREWLSVTIAEGVSTSGHEESEADDRRSDGVEGLSDVAVERRRGDRAILPDPNADVVSAVTVTSENSRG